MRWTLMVALLTACGGSPIDGTAEIEAIRVSGAWVFAYEESPDGSMDALHTGRADIVDGCLVIGEATVVWRPEQLPDVEAIVAQVEDGMAIDVQLGGGGSSLAEGSTLADFPEVVVDRCDTAEIWYAGGGDVTVSEATVE